MTALKPILAVTMGDPTGTGPELITQAFPLSEVREVCRPIVVGSPSILRAAATVTSCAAEIREIGRAADATDDPSVIQVITASNLDASNLVRAKISSAGGQAAYESISRAVDLTLAGESHAVVTSAINNAALH